MKYKIFIFAFIWVLCFAYVRNLNAGEINITLTGTVTQTGSYTFIGDFSNINVDQPKRVILGSVTVGLNPSSAPYYNGAYPWVMRVYTNNTGFSGKGSRAGLISSDGKHAIPVKVWCLNFGPASQTDDQTPPSVDDDNLWKDPLKAVWVTIPDITDDGYTSYQPDFIPHERNDDDVVLVGVDPRNASWAEPDNPLGDTRLISLVADSTRANFKVWFAIEVAPTTPVGSYTGNFVFEVVESP